MKIKKSISILLVAMFLFLFNINATTYAAVTIKNVDPINVTVKQGEKYTLPKTVTATYSNKTQKAVSVTWNPSSINTSKVGVYTFKGSIKGYSKKAVLKLTVVAYISSISNINVTIKQGEKYTLPNTISATYSDKSKKNVAVTWNAKSIDTKTIGNFTYIGTVAGYSKKVTLKLSIILPKLTLKEISAKSASVVTITITDRSGEKLGFGSGFITSSDGEVVTNYHVIEDVYSAYVTTENGKKYNVKGMLAADADKDIAVIKLENAVGLPALALGDSSKLERAEEVVAIGSPQGYVNTISTGIVSGVDRVSEMRKGKDIQTTAAIDHGSSGGALFNMYGQVVGITYAGYSTGSLGFAIPINEVKPFLGKKDIVLFSSTDIAKIPTAVTATAVSDSEIHIQWNEVKGADYYYVYSSKSIDGEYSSYYDEEDYKMRYDWNPDFSSIIYNLVNNTAVYFKVTAVINGVESDFSSIASATTSEEIKINFLPRLPEVPCLSTFNFEKEIISEDGKYVSYGYNLESLSYYYPVESYENLLKRYGWKYYSEGRVYDEKNSAEAYSINYIKDSKVVSITLYDDYIVITGNLY